MKKTIKKIFIFTFLTFALVVLAGVSAFGFLYFTGEKVTFDQGKFYQSVNKIDLYDQENRLIEEDNSYNADFIKLQNINPQTIDAFISIEDKEFYNHKGLNYKRIVKALFLDIKNGNMAQGASTISQQLIKNTHLSSQKTFSRKINEIVLAKELENKLSKEQILENYLNIIYFGDNCYGIEKATNHYFSKSAKDLLLPESALLAGLISSPTRYSPITNEENALNRRNLVLREMLKDKKISQEEFEKAIEEKITLTLEESPDNKLNAYTEAALDEAMEILKLPAKQISLGEYKIYTHYNKEKQQKLLESIKDVDFKDNNFAAINIKNKTGEVEAFYGNGNYKILNIKRQPASAIKPVLVYAPAINEGIVTPITQILDEELSISGYTPKNHDLQYHGYLSVRDSVSKSYNIPAVKIMSYVGLEKAKRYAKISGIEFDEKDDNYAVALGGMTYGTDLKTLTGTYSSFANNGEFSKPRFVNYITDKNNNIVYISSKENQRVFSPDTAYLMNDVLVYASKNGTSKGLANLDYQIGSKTGTVGKLQTNIDAWAVSYTTNDLFGVWVGNFDNSPIGDIVGGTVPIQLTKKYFEKIYSENKPKNFDKPDTIVEIEIDLKELKENHQIVMANNFLPNEYKLTEIFSTSNLPKQPNFNTLNFKPAELDGFVEDGYAILKFVAQDFMSYELISKSQTLKTFENENGEVVFKYLLTDNKPATFNLKTKLKNYATGEEFVDQSKGITLMKTKNTSEKPIEKIKAKWYL